MESADSTRAGNRNVAKQFSDVTLAADVECGDVKSKESNVELEVYKQQVVRQGAVGQTPTLPRGGHVTSTLPQRVHVTPRHPTPTRDLSVSPTPTATQAAETGDVREKPATNKVVISHVVSPGQFYVQLAQASDDLNKFMDGLQKDYALSEAVLMGWEEDNFCAVQLTHDNRWYRAKIIFRQDEHMVEILATDYGYQDMVHVSRLRPLVAERQDPPAYALRCHLAAVQPAGTTNVTHWSQTSTEYMQCMALEHVFYIDIKGNLDEGSLPVDLLFEKITKGDALTADTIEYNSVTKLIVNKGLALPKRVLPFQKPGEPGKEKPLVSKPPQPHAAADTAERSPSPQLSVGSGHSSYTLGPSDGDSQKCNIRSPATSHTLAGDGAAVGPLLSVSCQSSDSACEILTSSTLKSTTAVGNTTTISKSPALSVSSRSSCSSGGTRKNRSVKSSALSLSEATNVHAFEVSPAHSAPPSLCSGREDCSVVEEGITLRLKNHKGKESLKTDKCKAEITSKEIEVLEHMDKTPVREMSKSRLPSPPQPTRVVHGSVRTKAFFSNLPVKHSSPTTVSRGDVAITAAPISDNTSHGKQTNNANNNQFESNNTAYSPGESVESDTDIYTADRTVHKETLIDSPKDGSSNDMLEETYETCSEDEDDANVTEKLPEKVPKGDGCVEAVPSTQSKNDTEASEVCVDVDSTQSQTFPEEKLKPSDAAEGDIKTVQKPELMVVDAASSAKTLPVKSETFLYDEENDKTSSEEMTSVDKDNVAPADEDRARRVADEDSQEHLEEFEMRMLPEVREQRDERDLQGKEDYPRWKAADLVDMNFNGVPTYVDYDGVISVQLVHDATSMEGRFGYLLKENTLETVLQNAYLTKHSLYRAHIPRDGNCLFRAFAEAMYCDQTRQGTLRQNAVKTITTHWDMFKVGIEEDLPEIYAKKMNQSGTFGGEPEIQALSWLHNVRTTVYMGGLTYPVTHKEYGSPQDTQYVELIYVSDGQYDAGHYDLVARTPDRMEKIEEVYAVWRKQKIVELQNWNESADNTVYDDSLLGQLMCKLQDFYADKEADPSARYVPGQAVVACFTDDDQFYRAVITQIDNDQYKVHYVDFGNSETVCAEALRSAEVLCDIPIQCQQCELAGVQPNSADSRWSTRALEYVHASVAGNTCSFEVQEMPAPGKNVKVRIYLPDGRDLIEDLLAQGLVVVEGDVWGAYRSVELQLDTPGTSDTHVPEVEEEEDRGDGSTLTEKEEYWDSATQENLSLTYDLPEILPERTVPTPYRQLDLEADTEYYMTVTQIDTPNQVYLQFTYQDGGDPGVQHRNQLLDDLETMSITLQQDAPNYSKLDAVRPGTPCVCQYSHDEAYYRAEVISLHHSTEPGGVPLVGLLFIDYGSDEYVHPDKLRHIPAELMELPAQGVRVKVAGVVPGGDSTEWHPELKQWLTQLCANKTLLVKVRCMQPEILVELYDYESTEPGNSAPQLVYQPLIDMGLMKIVGTVYDEQGVIVEAEEDDGDDDDDVVVEDEDHDDDVKEGGDDVIVTLKKDKSDVVGDPDVKK